MKNVYTDPYMPDEEDLVEVGDLRPWMHEVHCKQRVNKNVLKQRVKENQRAEIEWMSNDSKKLHMPATTASCVTLQALGLIASKHWKSMRAKHHE